MLNVQRLVDGAREGKPREELSRVAFPPAAQLRGASQLARRGAMGLAAA